MAKKFMGPMPEDAAEDLGKVDLGNGPLVTDAKPKKSVDRSSWSEANKLDYQVSIDAGRSPEEAAARIEARRAKAQRVQASKQPTPPVSKLSAGTRTSTPPARQSTAGRGSSTPAPVQARTSSVGVPSKRPSKPEVRSSPKPTPPVLVDKPKPAAKAGSSSPAPAKDKGRPQAKPAVRVDTSYDKLEATRANRNGPPKPVPSSLPSQAPKQPRELTGGVTERLLQFRNTQEHRAMQARVRAKKGRRR